jgi:hypothetical protein
LCARTVILVRGRRGGRQRGTRGRGVMPPVASTPEGPNPQGDEPVLGLELIAVGDAECDDEILSVHVRGTDQPIGQRRGQGAGTR